MFNLFTTPHVLYLGTWVIARSFSWFSPSGGSSSRCSASQVQSPSNLRRIGRLEFDIGRYADCYYVVINPTTAGTYLYLSDRDYVRLMNTCITQGNALILVAEPGELETIVAEREAARQRAQGKPGGESTNSPLGRGRKRLTRKTQVQTVNFLNKKLGRPMIREEAAMLSLSDPKGLVAVVLKLSSRIVKLTTGERRASNRIRVILNFIALLWRSARVHGSVWVVKYLKACHVALASYISGVKVSSLRVIERGLPMYRLYNGLPACIPKSDRQLIRRLDPGMIRFWMTLFSIYRVIKIPAIPKLETITTPVAILDSQSSKEDLAWSYSNSQEWLVFIEFLSRYAVKIISYYSKEKIELRQLVPLLWDFHRTRAADPNCSSGMRALVFSLKAWYMQYPDIETSPLWSYINLLGSNQFKKTLETFSVAAKDPEFLKPYITKYCKKSIKGVEDLRLGQLSFKEEPAGKLRVFALRDIWTQWALKPLHNFLMKLCSKIPMDSTLDQDAAVQRLIRLCRHLNVPAYSFDLSSATDRIPIQAYVSLLEAMFGEEFAFNWWMLISQVDFIIPPNKFGLEKGKKVRYEVGQPMGTLSSWILLNLVHHMLVQYSAYKCKRKLPFTNYQVLGDDIVILDKEVALAYGFVLYMFGIRVNYSKSIISSGSVFEFAKRLVLNGVHVAGLPWKLLCQDHMTSRVTQVIAFSKLGLINSVGKLSAVLSRSFRDEKALVSRIRSRHPGLTFSLLSLIGSQARMGLIPLDALARVWVNPVTGVASGILPTFQLLRVAYSVCLSMRLSQEESTTIVSIEYLYIISEYNALSRIKGSQLVLRVAALRILDKCIRIIHSFPRWIPQKIDEYMNALVPGWRTVSGQTVFYRTKTVVDFGCDIASQNLLLWYNRLYPQLLTSQESLIVELITQQIYSMRMIMSANEYIIEENIRVSLWLLEDLDVLKQSVVTSAEPSIQKVVHAAWLPSLFRSPYITPKHIVDVKGLLLPTVSQLGKDAALSIQSSLVLVAAGSQLKR